MKSKPALPILLLLLSLIATVNSAYPQRMSGEDRVNFSENISRIKVWTRILGDTSFAFHLEAMNTIRLEMNRRGYAVEQVFYEKSTGLSPEGWENRVIHNLAGNEALLDVVTLIMEDTLHGAHPSERNVSALLAPGGQVIAKYNEPVAEGPQGTSWFSRVSMNLYTHFQKDSLGAFVPVYSRFDSVRRVDIGNTVKNMLFVIPKSNHPVAFSETEKRMMRNKTRAEFTAIGGYVFPSSMDVMAKICDFYSQVHFHSGAQYGFETSVGLSRSMDILASYLREDTRMDIDDPEYTKSDELAMSFNYILLGVNYHFRVNRMVSPYLGASLGSLNIVFKDKYYREVWYFALGAQAGVKFYLTKWIGVRIQGQLLYQVRPEGAPFLYSMNIYNVPVDSGSNMLQFGVNGGFIFRLGTWE